MNEIRRLGTRASQELDQAEQWLGGDRTQRRVVVRALAAAIALHAIVLVARMPKWGPDPVRVTSPIEQAMKVQFLRPPPPPKAPERPPEPEKKRVPRPDPTPDKPEPVKAAPPPPAASVLQAPTATGPVRVTAGQGPGLIKKVEPIYPPIARAARIEGNVVVDAIILKDGSVSNVTILSSSNQMFDQSCIDAVRRWRFTPGSNDVVLTVTVRFTLREQPP